MELLKAQAAIAELLAEYDRMVGYAAKVNGSGLFLYEAAEQAQAEVAASAYLAGAYVVARHFGIRLKPQPQK